jgi:hypothetical protein
MLHCTLSAVTAANCGTLAACPDIDGFLVSRVQMRGTWGAACQLPSDEGRRHADIATLSHPPVSPLPRWAAQA